MQPTLFKGDRIVANKLVYKYRMPRRGEVVIFKVYSYTTEKELRAATPEQMIVLGRPSFMKNDRLGERFVKRDYIKRVAGLPGDVVEIRDHQLFINEERVDEPWITDPIYDFKYNYPSIVVPEDHLFVLGDNHNNSQDSHKLGFLPLEQVVGKAMFVFFPTENIKIIK
jgi:signal peptidase I